jgi:hypothetical protein
MSSNFARIPGTRLELLEMMYHTAQREPLGNVRFLPFILKEDIKTFLPRLNVGGFRSKVETFEDFYLLRLQRIQMELDANDAPVSGDFALFETSGAVWCFCTIETTTVLGKTVIPAIQRHPSRASLIYISTKEFRRLFDNLAADNNRLLVVQHNEYNRQESNINFLKERKDYKIVFAELTAKDAVARKIAAEIHAQGRRVSAFSFNNNGLLSLRYGSVQFFFDRLVNEVAAIGNIRNSLFANRERSRTQLHPLELLFETGILSDKAANSVLIDSLSSIAKSAIAVFHSNPYIHVLYTDFRDGSSFNIYSSSDSALTIVPSTRASVSALMRLYRGISERFADCDVSEPAQSPPTMNEFFGE